MSFKEQNINLETIFLPIKIGNITLRNRIGLAPINTGMINSEGIPTSHFREFHAIYSRNGAGIVFVGGVAVRAEGRSSSQSLYINSKVLPALRETTKAVHASGSTCAIQLMHAGRQTRSSEIGSQPVAASPIPCAIVKEKPRALSLSEIAQIIESFVNGAVLAQSAGFRVVEIHAAHGYLISGFLSPISNHRTDIYGGPFNNRIRLLLEIISAIRSSSPDILLGVRINVSDFVPGGWDTEDFLRAIPLLAKYGINYISATCGVYALDDRIMPHHEVGGDHIWQISAAAKSLSPIPVMIAGNIRNLKTAEAIIKNRSADIALLGRALLANPKMLISKNTITCRDRRLCKYHTNRLPQIACPYNKTLLRWLKEVHTVRSDPSNPLRF
jgi:2,4-dienoyl-CoA reductase-like NADH-dependent reductase (Old Yellow Enzyme family)